MINASLGAHYSDKFVKTSFTLWLQTLFGLPINQSVKGQLTEMLGKMFEGQAVLTYKGRDAIELALRSYGVGKGDQVLTQAFACYAIEEAIVRAGAAPYYVDLGKNQLNLTVKTLEVARKKAKKAKAVIVQYSLGHLAEIDKIAAWCKKHKLLLIEDLAQGFGGEVGDQAVGTFGGAIVLSFGRDKIIDAVTGGAVIFRQPPVLLPPLLPTPSSLVALKDLLYPTLTWLIRGSFDLYLGKLLHKFFTIIGLMGNPTQAPTSEMTDLPASFAKLALMQLQEWPEIRRVRQVTASLYLEALANTPLKFVTNANDLKNGSLLRVAAAGESIGSLIDYLRKQNIHLTDRWYRSPVDCGQLNCATHYKKGSCPNAESMADTVINLPTHAKLRIADTEKIINSIQQYFAHANH